MEPVYPDLTPATQPSAPPEAVVASTSGRKLRRWALALMILGLAIAYVAGSVLKGTVPGPAFSSGIILTGAEDPSYPLGFAPIEDSFPGWPREQVEEVAQVWEGLAVVSAKDKKGERVVLLGVPESLLNIIQSEALKNGRFPAPNKKEILAGANCEPKQTSQRRLPRRVFGGQRFAVVGTLSPELTILDNAYVTLFENISAPSLPEVRPNMLVILPKPGFFTIQAAALFFEGRKPPEGRKIAARIEEERVSLDRYMVSCIGLTLVFVGGAFFFIGLLPGGGQRPPGQSLTLFGQNLETLARARTAYIWANLACYLFIVVPMFSAYNLPHVQKEFGGFVEQSFSDEGYLHFVSRAYEHSVLSAALATFAVNFFGGTFFSLTLPSFIFPGSGFAIGALRSILVGVVLAPSTPGLISKMVPHSLTVALEMQGYIIAMACSARMFEALLAPRRFGEQRRLRAFLAAAKETLSLYPLIAMILLIAALYEAVELRHLIGFFEP